MSLTYMIKGTSSVFSFLPTLMWEVQLLPLPLMTLTVMLETTIHALWPEECQMKLIIMKLPSYSSPSFVPRPTTVMFSPCSTNLLLYPNNTLIHWVPIT
jgi:hypothetical protein